MNTEDYYHPSQDVEYTNSWQNSRYNRDGSLDTSFPYPDKHTRSLATGELERRIRAALIAERGEEVSEHDSINYDPIVLLEVTTYGGYSEYTQENMRDLEIICGEESKKFEHDWNNNTLMQLMEWLDDVEKGEKMRQLGEPEYAEYLAWKSEQNQY